MKDRISEHPNRIKATDVTTGDAYVFDVELSEGTVSEAGTPFATSTILADSTATALGLTSAATPNDAFAHVASVFSTVLDGDETAYPATTPSGSIYISSNGTYDVASYADAVVSVSASGGDETNFLITMRASSGSIYDSQASSVFTSTFYQNAMITGVEMTSVEVIGSSAFYGCSNLMAASFAECVSVWSGAFQNCSSLTDISFPACVSIGGGGFSSCTSLLEADFPACTTIGDRGFDGCTSLSNVSFPLCTNLNGSAFQSCPLTDVTFPACTRAGYRALATSTLVSASLPSCTYLFATFAGCTSLEDVSLPAAVTLDDNVFNGCTNLSVLSLPACTMISYGVFINCHNLISLYLLGPNFVNLRRGSAFSSTPMFGYSDVAGRYGSIFVPSSLYASYLADGQWAAFSERFVSV